MGWQEQAVICQLLQPDLRLCGSAVLERKPVASRQSLQQQGAVGRRRQQIAPRRPGRTPCRSKAAATGVMEQQQGALPQSDQLHTCSLAPTELWRLSGLRISRHSGLGQKHRVAFAAQQTSSPGVCGAKGQQRWADWHDCLQQGQVERITS
jgi:hypothetical protein